MVVLDTNIIIDHIRQPLAIETVLLSISRVIAKHELAVAIVSIQELYGGTSTRDPRRSEFLLATLAPLKILPYTYEAARLAGEISRNAKRTIAFADAAIAATTVVHGAALATLNAKDFRAIPELKLYRLPLSS